MDTPSAGKPVSQAPFLQAHPADPVLDRLQNALNRLGPDETLVRVNADDVRTVIHALVWLAKPEER